MTGSNSVGVHDQERLEELMQKHRIDPHLLKRFRILFFKKQLLFEKAAEVFPAPFRDQLGAMRSRELEMVSRHDSTVDGASKLIFRTGQDQLIESVILRIATGRTTLCLSTQSGCAVNCGFCATGKMGLKQNLNAQEILDQVIQTNQLLLGEGRQVRNIVFMGMGEPFHNEENLFPALRALAAPRLFGFDPGRLLVSTIGIPGTIERFAREFPKVRLALSLHSAREKVRNELIPMARHFPLPTLKKTLLDYCATTGQQVMIEYILLAGLTDREEDLKALAQFVEGLEAHINLIPLNAIDFRPDLLPSSKKAQEHFSAGLKATGLKVTTRYSLGSDIAAACGQLVKKNAALV